MRARSTELATVPVPRAEGERRRRGVGLEWPGMSDSGLRLSSGETWRELCARLASLEVLVRGEGAPESNDLRAVGFRYLTRFLAAGLRVCIEADDPDYPIFARMTDDAMSWGLDNPDCNYSFARVRGDARYLITGTRGSARHIEFQVNTGHLGDGNAPGFGNAADAWRTLSFVASDTLHCEADGHFEIRLSREQQPGNWLRLDGDARYVLVRQYFDDWEREVPAVFSIEREDASYPPPLPTAEQLARHFETLATWLDAGARCWDRVSRLLLSLAPNTLLVFDVSRDVDRPGLHGQSYGMGPFVCAADEAVVVEFTPPRCLLWSVALANSWWESMDFGARQSSLNAQQAELDADGVFRGVIAQRDPGVPNWLDPEGSPRGTLAVRFLFADVTPKPVLRAVKLAELDAVLHPRTRRVDPAERSAVLARRQRALQRRYGY